MAAKNHPRLVQRRLRHGLSSALRLISVAALLGVWAATPAHGQVFTYSDSWFVENSGATPAEEYEGAPEIESTIPSEPAQNQVVGMGATEADYNSGSQSVQVTLTAPDGTTTSAVAYDYQWYSRTEVALPYTLDVNDRAEQSWRVTTGHYYWMNDSCYGCEAQVGYKSASARPLPRYYFFPIDLFTNISLSGASYTGLVIQPPYGVRPFRCLYSRRTCTGSRCGAMFHGMMFYAYGNAICQEYLQAYWVRIRIVHRVYCLPVYGISTSVPGECF